ncbi:MAG: tRNA (adenosine(37)-N6)-threonylcarbamoyltransferase complex ATPase subunit type 1 TsaE [Ruminococcaceae bacterium]|nr:tRNA (adenosine(37)-N6)-threonylcarbamoyltransferase complex ATPase subunit type 1 TsaE [Oscillospiraceae bacterium]
MKFPFVINTDKVELTENVGRELATALVADTCLPRFVAMYGDLGVGKTSFVRGFASALAPNAAVKSPTFALVNEYKCIENSAKIKKICHFDMYRIVDEDDLYSVGFYDYLRPDSFCIAEWCEMIPFALPKSYIKVEIEKTDLGDGRKITVTLV